MLGFLKALKGLMDHETLGRAADFLDLLEKAQRKRKPLGPSGQKGLAALEPIRLSRGQFGG